MEPFDQAAAHLPAFLRAKLAGVPEDVKADATELRLRAGGAVSITTSQGPVFIMESGRASRLWQAGCLRLDGAQLGETLRCLCGYSVHSYTEDIARGFLTLPGGHRAGLCGTAVLEGGEVKAVRDLSSVNLRIARQIPGAAAALCAKLYPGGALPGVLISGAPGSGKTTLLRDLARRLSAGLCGGGCRRVAIVDERCELAGARGGEPCCDVGPNTDVLSGYPKAAGVALAMRSLAPEVILCDELGGEEDAAALEAGFFSGVQFVATLHAGGAEEALRRPAARRLLACGALDWLAHLHGPGRPETYVPLKEADIPC